MYLSRSSFEKESRKKLPSPPPPAHTNRCEDKKVHNSKEEESGSMITERTRRYSNDGTIEDSNAQPVQAFINHGLIRWEEGRAKWLSREKSDEDSRRGDWRDIRRRMQCIPDDEAIYDAVFSKPIGWLLPQPVPLAHMIEILEDEWSD